MSGRSSWRAFVASWPISGSSNLTIRFWWPSPTQKLHLGAKAHVELPDSPGQLEKIFGTALPVGYKHLMRGLECAESVGKITDASDEPWGTGFLLRGSLIHADFGDGLVLATNAHVCSPEPGVGKLLPSEAKAVFDVTKSVDGSQLVLTGFECLWSSPPSVCDVTILRFTGPEAGAQKRARRRRVAHSR